MFDTKWGKYDFCREALKSHDFLTVNLLFCLEITAHFSHCFEKMILLSAILVTELKKTGMLVPRIINAAVKLPKIDWFITFWCILIFDI